MSEFFYFLFGKGCSNRHQQTQHGQSHQQAQSGWHGWHGPQGWRGWQGWRGHHGPPIAHGSAPPPSPQPIGVGFFLNNGVRLEVQAGDITALQGGAVVAWENNNFTGGGGIAKALLRKGGDKYFEARRRMINEYLNRQPCTDVVLQCPAGDKLAFMFVFHALLTFQTDRGLVTMNSFEQLIDVYGHVLDLASRLRVTTIVTPLLGSGASGGRLKDCVEAALVAISNLKDSLIETITIVEYNQVKAQDIGMQLKDSIERHAFTRHQSPAPPRPSCIPASDTAFGYLAPDRRTSDPHGERGQGPPKRYPAPPQPFYSSTPDRTTARPAPERRAPDPQRGRHRDDREPRTPERPFVFSPPPSQGSAQRAPPGPFPADRDTGDSYQGETKRIVGLQTVLDKACERNEVLAQMITAKISSQFESKSPLPADPGKQKSQEGRNTGLEVTDTLPEERPPWTPGGDTDYYAERDFRGQRKSKAQVPRENADVSHQVSPSAPDLGLDRGLPLQVRPPPIPRGDTDHYTSSHSRGQRKSKVQVPREDATISHQMSPSSPIPVLDRDLGADFHFRGQRKSKAQVPREDADISQQRSPSSPDPLLDKDQLLDTSEDTSNQKGYLGDTSTTGRDTEDTITTGRDTEDTTTTGRDTEDTITTGRDTQDTTTTGRDTEDTITTGRGTEDTTATGRDIEDQEETTETALYTGSSGQDPGNERGNRGQRKVKLGNAGLAAGNSVRDSDSARFSDREMLRSIVGSMPKGTMTCSLKLGTHVPGFEDCGMIVVDYDIPDGIQKSEHPQPGSPYCGCAERAFLPDNEEGRRVLRLLEEAFDRRLTFQVCEQPGGQALVEWVDIPHKTCLRGPRTRGGYPDPGYLETVQNVLREKYGIE